MARLAVKGALSKRYGVAVHAHESAHAFLDSMFRPDHNGAVGAGAVVDPSHLTDQPRCLILMDHMMPVMDGEQVLDHIPAGHPHFIAMMSGTNFTAEHREIIRKKGVSAFFEKPLEWEIFDTVLTQAADEL
jgi:CheY-like chemotaxis protein